MAVDIGQTDAVFALSASRRDSARAMSQGNVEIVRAAIDAYNRGDMEAALSVAAPDCELDWSRSIGPQRGMYRIDQIAEVNLAGTLESVRTEPQELIAAGEYVVTPMIGYARGRDGIETTARFTYLWTLRDGAVVRVTLYQGLQEALEAAGLEE
jgi:ketosteroid isomerase-like protein